MSIYILVLVTILVNFFCCGLVFWKVIGYRNDGVSVKGSALYELSKRLVWYPVVQFCTRLFDVVIQIHWLDKTPFLVNLQKDGERNISNGLGHMYTSRDYQAVYAIRTILLDGAGFMLVCVYFRFSAKGWAEFKLMVRASQISEFCEPATARLRAIKDRLSALMRDASATTTRLSEQFFDHIPRRQQESPPGDPSAERAFKRSTKSMIAFVGTDKATEEGEPGEHAHDDLKSKDDDELLALLEREDEDASAAAGGACEPHVDHSKSIKLELSKVYKTSSIRLSENPLHRIDPAA
jgi:hypothetical protein